jgi:D-sedoheptulose 7-phosphate isomerase
LGYENVFSFQLQRKASPGDLCIAFSASGNSTNIINAIKFANENSIETFAIVGFDGGSLLSMTKNTIHIRSEIGLYGPIEDIHLYICHNITDQVKKRLKQNEFN